ncbi:IclR family transcriptional regulator [Tsukamurella tyrosinosolvens]|uniref:IclR family transcriptional regulator n=1 Tax=Tsukamurella tyrosinosolvens TaxID=57704 RepID=UPI003F4A643C
MTARENALSGRQPKAVISALRVLEEVARGGEGITAKEITARLGMPSATTYRLLTILVGEGYIVRVPDLSGFALGRRLGVILDAAVAPSVCAAARDVLAEARLSVRFGVQLFYVTGSGVRAADLDPEYPPQESERFLNDHLYACAVGKLLLAERDGAELPALRAVTRRTPADPDALRRELEAVRADGYAAQVGEMREDTACVAVPIRSRDGALVAALALSGQAEHAPVMVKQVEAMRGHADRLAPLLA